MKTEYTKQEEYLIEWVLKNPNLKQQEIADQCILSKRKCRDVINAIRKKGWITKYGRPMWLVGDNNGYALCYKDTDRLDNWVKRYSGYFDDMGKVLEVFHQTDLFTNFN